MRIQVISRGPDGRAHKVLDSLKASGIAVDDHVTLSVVDVYLIAGCDHVPASNIERVFIDPVCEVLAPEPGQAESLFEVTFKPGVTNPSAITAREALRLELGSHFPVDAVVQTALQYRIAGMRNEDRVMAASLLHNPLIQMISTELPEIYPHEMAQSDQNVELIEIGVMGGDALMSLSKARTLSLSLEEMRAIQEYAAYREPKGFVSDIELEVFAQTWSEHCKHKIFAAQIDYDDGTTQRLIDGLYPSYIKAVTRRLSAMPGKDYVRSVFHDNAGVIDFDDDHVVCIKAETHNSPSALDPYGGAITGIVGVNRDILGTGKGARPIFNTDVLCFGDPDTPHEDVPAGLLSPQRVLSGVHEGIVDGGNQSGIPVVAGGFLFDDCFLGKPLVFCGTGGVMPRHINGEESWIKHIDAGDLAVMVGGRIGKDGIHGATFSSQALDETSSTSAVQIGDPIIQKRMTDFLLEARDLGLYKGITDNGAGGLSSSLGEMAESSGGIHVDLDKCPLKYPGLAPWEIFVSESQERMSLSVDPSRLDELLELARRRGVEATVVGEFTDSGRVTLGWKGETVADIDLTFMHEGVPRMQLPAQWIPADSRLAAVADTVRESGASKVRADAFDASTTLLQLLAEPNITSKESLIRQYDHEVQGQTVIKPFVGPEADGPSDGGLIRPFADSGRGLAVTHGICPRVSMIDTRNMAAMAVDEALRAAVAMGADPDRAAALDNFCWPDPVLSDQTPDGPYKLAQLVRACEGLAET